MIAGVFEWPARLLAWFYSFTNNYIVAISLIAVVVMLIITPLTLKSTKGMLEMQRLAPEMRRLQSQYRNDRAKLNEEMMKLYQEHKVNPMSSCLPLLAQMPVFIIMFRVLHGLTYSPTAAVAPVAHAVYAAAGQPKTELGFLPRYVAYSSELFQSLVGQTEMMSFGLDLAKSPAEALADNFAQGLVYVLLVALLGALYFVQQRMVAARAAVSPTMSPAQQKLMQYLPVVFAVFQVFFLLGLVIYYMAQAILRIGQQAYITRAFYGHDEALGRQAQRAGERARELAKDDPAGSSGGLFGQAKRELAASKTATTSKSSKATDADKAPPPTASRETKRTTAPKGRPTPSGKGPAGRPPSTTANRPGGPRAKQAGKRSR
jgi:YidC/Oxa1 family membrane protein insertase